MILSKLGKFIKRVTAFLAVLVIIHAVALEYPARAAAALPVIGAAVTLSAFLMVSGIYPYIDSSNSEGLTFDSWSTGTLQTLWKEFQVQQQVTPPDFDRISALLSGATILISNNLWLTLIDFANWIKNKFALTDNMGITSGVQKTSVAPYFSTPPTAQELKDNGIYVLYNAPGRDMWYGVSKDLPYPYGALFCWDAGNYYDYMFFFGRVQKPQGYYGNLYSCTWENNSVRTTTIGWNGNYSAYVSGLIQSIYAPETSGAMVFSSPEEAIAYFAEQEQNVTDGNLWGIDTTTVEPPAALPETAQFGGLAIPAAGLSPTAEQVSQVIENGIVDRAQPQVVPVEVEIGAGTEVDTETGVIAQNPVEITQESAIPGVDALVSQPLITAIANTMQTKFPFCLPFDIMRLFRAFNATPQAPQISLTFTDPFSEHDYTISVDLSPWDNVAGTVRQFETMILFVGFWLNFDKFNILNMILGQLG